MSFLLCALVFFYLCGRRSLAGVEELPADIDVPEQEETEAEREVEGEEVDETQQQRVDEEVQSIQGFEGRKVR